MSEFRAFGYLWDPTMQAVTSDGVIVQTSASVLDLLRFTPVPVYVPETGGRGMVDESEGLEWECVGKFGRILRYPQRELLGVHMPENVRIEFQDWCETFVRAHPNTPMIPRTEVAYQRNSYTTTHTCLFTHTQLKGYFDDCVRKYDTGSRRSYTQQAARFDQHGSSAPAHGHRAARNTSRSRAGDVAMAHVQEEHSLFNEDGSGDSHADER